MNALILGAIAPAHDAGASVTYYHLQLPRHDVLLAEGLPAESYLDTGNAAAFDNGDAAMALHPDFNMRVWEAEGCAPLVVAGPQVAAARARLACAVRERAAA